MSFKCGIEIAFIWDISDLLILCTDEIIDKKVVLSPQDFLDSAIILQHKEKPAIFILCGFALPLK